MDEDEVFDRAYYTLEPHASYISTGPGDKGHYFIPAEVLESLTWIALNITVPMLTSVGSSLIYDRLKRRKAAHDRDVNALSLSQEELDRIRSEVVNAIAAKDSFPTPSINVIVSAREDLAITLRANGFPPSHADSDAKAVVNLLADAFWPGEFTDDE